ncbi:ABC transporter ATP-binding protein [Lapillicoccus sp.]|uniref:ABC transporter ATP-binding protein n=1 Tax=Lapillicoccus sp. TaxID=1909287 RepID=UPI003982EF7A
MIATIRCLRPFARQHRRALTTGGLLAVLEVLVNLAQPWPVSLLVGSVLTKSGSAPTMSPTMAVGAAVGSLLLIYVLAAIVNYWSTRLLSSTGLRMAADVRVEVYAHLQRQSLAFHAGQRVGDLTARVTSDVDRMQDLLVQSLSVLIPNAMLVLGMGTVMLILDPTFALVAFTATPVMAVVIFRSTRALKRAARRARTADGQVAAAAAEGLSVMPLVQACSLEPRMRNRMESLALTSLLQGLEATRLQARFSPVVDVASAASLAVVLAVGSWRVLDGHMSVAVLLVFLGYVSSLYKPLKALAKLSTVTSKGTAAAERVLDILAMTPDVRNAPHAVAAGSLAGRIDFENVTFSYGREPVISGLDLHIDPGETLALVGRTGAGKSTIAALVPRLMDPQEGRVLLDGMDVRGLELETVRAQVSLVLQDCVLLHGSLLDNIACGRPDATEEAVRRAARLALVDEFAERLPLGLDTPVGERGVSLSGGQRQRVAIARAILRDTPILILDEPTSALDVESESLISQALEQLPSGRTTLIIAHRLSTVRRADRIAVLEGGRLIEEGAPEHLLRSGGHFARLTATQGALRVNDRGLLPLDGRLS